MGGRAPAGRRTTEGAVARYRNRTVFAHNAGASAGARLLRGLMAILGLALVGGVVFLGFWTIEPPSRTVDKPVEVPSGR